MSTIVGLDLQPEQPEDTVSVSQLGSGAAIVREVIATGRPKVLTEGDRSVAVILDNATFEALIEEASAGGLLRDLEESLADADAGHLVAHDEVLRTARATLAGHVPEEVIRQLGG